MSANYQLEFNEFADLIGLSIVFCNVLTDILCCFLMFILLDAGSGFVYMKFKYQSRFFK